MERAREESGLSLGLLRPDRIDALQIQATATPDWTAAERQKLEQAQKADPLFSEHKPSDLETLRKLPQEFHYQYTCDIDGNAVTSRHKIVD